MLPSGRNHLADESARHALRRAAAATGLQVAGGGLVRTSSRLCLAVEHGDYNGTDLFGVGTDRFTWIAWRANDRDRVRIWSHAEPDAGVVEFEPQRVPEPATAPGAGWPRFAPGAAFVLRRQGHELRQGFDAVVFADIPGGGMSRSASLAVNLLLVCLLANGKTPPPPLALARMAQAIENDYVGSPCGLLDPLLICHARRATGTLWSAATRTVQQLPLGGTADALRLLCLFTGKSRHGLQHSTYPQRQRECEELLALLRRESAITGLCDIKTRAQLDAVLQRHGQSHPRHCARLRYLCEARQRLPRLLQAWTAGDLVTLGQVFTADGLGLRDDYCISGPELEAMCDIARAVPGVLGARMLGGGDCGTAGALALPGTVERVRTAVAQTYPARHPQYAVAWAVHECRTSDGIAMLPPL